MRKPSKSREKKRACQLIPIRKKIFADNQFYIFI